jgi:hypothetical protein
MSYEQKIKNSKEYHDGAYAYMSNIDVNQCPYPPETNDGTRYRWHMGYYDTKLQKFYSIDENCVGK